MSRFRTVQCTIRDFSMNDVIRPLDLVTCTHVLGNELLGFTVVLSRFCSSLLPRSLLLALCIHAMRWYIQNGHEFVLMDSADHGWIRDGTANGDLYVVVGDAKPYIANSGLGGAR